MDERTQAVAGVHLAQVLADTARDVATIRDPDLLFRAIAERTRAAVGVEMAYVSINDPVTAMTAIRATAGVRTDAYARIAMPLGSGILGTAAGGAVIATDDYLGDTRRTHLSDVDDAVRGEGVRAIAGMPLTSAGTVVGALMVADRTAHMFSPAQLETLDALAGQVAVAVELVQARHRTRVLEQAVVVSEKEQREARARQNFRDAAAWPTTVSSVVDTARRVLGVEVALFDGDGLPLLPDAAAVIAPHTAADVISLATGRGSGGGTAELETDIAVGLLPAVDGSVIALALTPPPPHDTVLDIGHALLTARLWEDATVGERHRSHQELVTELLAFRAGDRALARRAVQAHLSPADGLIVVLIDIEDDKVRPVVGRIRSRLGEQGIVTELDGRVCAIVSADGGFTARDQGGRLSSDVDGICRTAVAGPVKGFDGLAAAYAEARTVLAALVVLGRTDVVADAAALGVSGLLLGATGTTSARSLIDEQLGALLEMSEPRRSELIDTALQFLDAAGSVAGTAQRLDVHVNTIRQRLEKLDAVLGAGWRGARRLDVHVALRAWSLRAVE